MPGEISRQTFLRGAVAALAAGTFTGAGRAGAEPIATGWDGLSISGSVIRPDWPIWRTPQFPVVVRLRLGQRFAPEADHMRLLKRLEQYFAEELK